MQLAHSVRLYHLIKYFHIKMAYNPLLENGSNGQNIQNGYREIPNAGTGTERLQSKILPIRDFNNWAKSALIQYVISLQQ